MPIISVSTKETIEALRQIGFECRGFDDFKDHINLSGKFTIDAEGLKKLADLPGFMGMTSDTRDGRPVIKLGVPAIEKVKE